MLAIIQATDNYDLYRVLYYVHIFSAIAAFGPLFIYPRLQRLGDTEGIARLHVRFVMPALVVMWVVGMGMAGVAKFSIGSMHWLTITILLWLIALLVSWFLIRPALSDPSEEARKKMSAGVGITHLILVLALWLMIFKPFVDAVYVFND